jgi:hypothetical protein
VTWLPDEALCTPDSDQTDNYNCLAWALGTELISVWPPGGDPLTKAANYWPPDLPQELSVATIETLLSRFGYARCDDGQPHDGHEKIVLFTDGTEPTHLARLRDSGDWTSKLGGLADVIHAEDRHAECPQYGSIYQHYERDAPGPTVHDVFTDPVAIDVMERTAIRLQLLARD